MSQDWRTTAHRRCEVNTYVTEQRLSSLRREGFRTIYADIGEYLEAADQPESWSQQRQLSRLAGEYLMTLQDIVDLYGTEVRYQRAMRP